MSGFVEFRPQTENMFFSSHVKKIPKRNMLRFFRKEVQKRAKKHRREVWLTSTRYFEVLVVKFRQTLFLNSISKKLLRKNFEFFLILFELFSAFQT